MQYYVVLALCIPAFAAGLNVRTDRLEGTPQSHHISKQPGVVSAIQFPPGFKKSQKLVWFLGCSIDQNAVVDSCLNGHEGVALVGDEMKHVSCSFDNVTLVYTFHPGASAPPYYSDTSLTNYGDSSATTNSIIKSRLQDMKRSFGKMPDATIVDTSIWDVANWWQKSGEPNDWHVPQKLIDSWCHETVPKFLDFVQESNPQGRVAFRSPPPTFNTRWRDWTRNVHETVEEMSTMLHKSKCNGKYPLIDYHQVAISTGKSLGHSLRELYRDDLHPGPKIGVALVDAALKWAAAL